MKTMNKLFVVALTMIFVSLAFVSAVTLPPIVNIGASPSITNLTSTITAIGIDLSGSGIDYVRIYESGVLVKQCSGSSCVFVAVHTTPGIRSYYATTADNKGGTAISSMINVNFQNSAPVLNAIGTQTVNESSLLTFTISGYDYNGDVLTYSASGLPLSAGAVFNPATQTFSWTPTFAQSGSYNVTFSVSDGFASDSEIVQINVLNVLVQDTEAPIITLLGNAIVTINVGNSYTDAGATALDTVDGDLTSNIVIINPVNTNIAGSYIITYNVHDTAGNPAIPVTRTVNVIDVSITDATPPVITLLGSAIVTINVGDSYTDAGAIATDDIDGNLTSSIVTVNPVNTAVAGTYVITYNVHDAAGNPAIQVTRTVNVIDNGNGNNNEDDSSTTTSKIRTVSTDDLIRGYYITMNIGDKLKFTFCGAPYYIKLTDSDSVDDKASFMITPGTNGFVLKEGESEKIDLDSNNVDDITFRLESAGTDKAKVYIKRVSDLCVGGLEVTSAGTTDVEKLMPMEKQSNLPYAAGFLVFGIVLCILMIIINSVRRTRKR